MDGTFGINFEGSNENLITRNSIYSNGVGIYIEFHCDNNYFTCNNLINNDRNANFFFCYEPLPKWSYKPGFNTWNRNYWSDWSSPVPKPIKGVLHVIFGPLTLPLSWYQFDMNPAAEPYDW